MKSYKPLFAIILSLLLGGAVFYAQQLGKQTPSPQQAEAEQKRIEHSKLYKKYTGIGDLRSIAATSKDDVEVLNGTGQKIFFPNATPVQFSAFVSDITQRADLIIIGKVDAFDSFLTEESTFVFTDYTLSVEQIIKNDSKAPLEPSSSIVVTRPGGTVQLNGRNIKASDESLAPLEKGRRYLLFLNSIPTTGAYKAFDSRGAFRINGARTAKLTKDQLPVELEHGADLSVMLALVQAALR
ncbi:MAG TPA: hypothetical protein VJV21_03280 [Pyrinomonadaceae bacterium]|nr:hypothetical protein [Pyrinomonadaceae bacterium]